MLPDKRRKLIISEKLPKVVKVAFFDADQTLRLSATNRPSPDGAKDVVILENCYDKLKAVAQDNYVLAIVSNQAGIQYKHVTFEQVEEAMQETIRAFARQGICFNYYDYAAYRDENRKPDIMMATRLQNELEKNGKTIDWEKSFMVGDAAWKRGKDTRPDGKPGTDHSNSDRLFAENLAKLYPGFRFFYAEDFFDNAFNY